MKKNNLQLVLLVVVCLLFVFSIVQTVQISELRVQGMTGMASSAVPQSQTQGPVGGVRQAPAMVGGC